MHALRALRVSVTRQCSTLYSSRIQGSLRSSSTRSDDHGEQESEITKRVRLTGLARNTSLESLTEHIRSLLTSGVALDRILDTSGSHAFILLRGSSAEAVKSATEKLNGSAYLGRVISARLIDQVDQRSREKPKPQSVTSAGEGSVDFLEKAQKERRAAESLVAARAREGLPILKPKEMESKERLGDAAQALPPGEDEVFDVFPDYLQLSPLDHSLLFERWVPWAAYSYRLMPVIPEDVSLDVLAVPPGTFGLGEDLILEDETESQNLNVEEVAKAILSVLSDNGENGLQFAMSSEGHFVVQGAKVAPVVQGWPGRLIESRVSMKNELSRNEWVSEARTILSDILELPLARLVLLFLPTEDKPYEGKLYVAVYPPADAVSSDDSTSLSPRESQRDLARTLFHKHALWRRDMLNKEQVVIQSNPRALRLARAAQRVLATDYTNEEEVEARDYIERTELRNRSASTYPKLEGLRHDEASALALAYLESLQLKPLRIELDDPRVLALMEE